MNTLALYKAETFLQRLQGLLFRKPLESHEGLLIKPCNDVHSFGMKYPIDVAYFSQDGYVLRVDLLQPNRVSRCKGAKFVIEFKAGCAVRHGVEKGCGFQLAEILNPATQCTIGERA